jgi:hypothetical protein
LSGGTGNSTRAKSEPLMLAMLMEGFAIAISVRFIEGMFIAAET